MTREPKAIAEYPKPALTGGGRTRPEYANDAPRKLRQLALTQVPRDVHGNAQRGAWARGWVDGVRRLSSRRNPYHRAGSGWQHGMGTLYTRGWRAGRDVYDVDDDRVIAPGLAELHRQRELLKRVCELLK